MNVLITGGTGFIGSRLACTCLERGYTVKVLGQENTQAEAENRKLLAEKGIPVILASVTDPAALAEAMTGIDLVFHLAATQHEMHVPDQKFWDVNVGGTQHVLAASVQAGVQRFVHGSTIGVYGALEGTIDEDSPCNPDNIYGETKLAAEKVVFSFEDKIPVVVIRISEVYGPGDRRLLKLFKGISKQIFFVIGNGKNLHHPIYIDDLTEGFLRAATAETAVGERFVLAGKEAVTTTEMVAAIATAVGAPVPRLRVPLSPVLLVATVTEKLLRPLGIQPPLHRRRMDFFKKSFTFRQEKAAAGLGFAPQTTFQQGVCATARWYQAMGYLAKTDNGAHSSPARQEETMALDLNQLDLQRLDFHRPTPGGSPVATTARWDNDALLDSPTDRALTAKIEPFDSYWQAPDNIEKGYAKFGQFYRANYLKYMPADKAASILVISCGPGYFVNMLAQAGYTNVLGIDSYPEKVAYAQAKKLNCHVARAFAFLENNQQPFDLIYAGQELNHLTKEEMVAFLQRCHANLKPGGRLIVYGLNGANPITGAENLAHNFDHYNTFTEYSLRQVLTYSGFNAVKVIPLNLYVFYKNPLNYVLMLIDALYTLFFRFSFVLYGKSVKVLTKKIAAVCQKG
jgi:nucleoside-diphosphate-sugar epimerase/2-polyprenyl-3-methyl-5-hydroxy-6-metoxy-1,4-benzoquinol methylase